MACRYLLIIIVGGLALLGCQASDYERNATHIAEHASLLRLNSKAGFFLPDIPKSNPITDEKIELGRHLFYDKRLSANQTQSCATCHQQDKAFTDGKALPVGSTGDILHRNSQTLTNVAYNTEYNWANSSLKTLEQQIIIPLTSEHPNPIELGITQNNIDDVIQRLRDQERYQDLFSKAFPNEQDPYTLGNIIKALASFNRILISDRSPFDQGELSPAAERGKALFFSEKMECFHCHDSFNFSLASKTSKSIAIPTERFFNNGLYYLGQEGDYPDNNQGLFDVTQNPKDKGKFRPPTLRNIELTAPYMHDGSIATLEGVLDFYAAGGRNIQTKDDISNVGAINQSLGINSSDVDHLKGDGRENPNKKANGFVSGFDMSPSEKSDLIEFLNSLTDREFIKDPRFSNPFKDGNDAR